MSDRSARSGRKARHAKRAAPPSVNPAAPGQRGGQYRPLSNLDCQNIFDMALRLLSDLGMGEVPTRLWDDLIGAGCVDLGQGPHRDAACAGGRYHRQGRQNVSAPWSRSQPHD